MRAFFICFFCTPFFAFAANTQTGYDIIVIAGQSNAVGYGCGPYQDANQRYDDRIDQIFPNGSVDRAEEPLTFADGGTGGKGFAMTFARLYAANLPAGRRVLLVPVALGGTSILQWDDLDEGFDFSVPTNNLDPIPRDSDLLYRRLVRQTRWAMQAGWPGQSNRIVALLWHQGETDMTFMFAPNQPIHQAMPDVAAYQTRLHKLIELYRKSLGQEFPVIAGEIGRFLDPPFNGPNGVAAFNGMLHTMATHEKSMAIANSDGLGNGVQAKCSFYPLPNGQNDPVHFNAQSQVEFGKRYYDAFRKLTGSALQAMK